MEAGRILVVREEGAHQGAILCEGDHLTTPSPTTLQLYYMYEVYLHLSGAKDPSMLL